jgi:hypothetical protein
MTLSFFEEKRSYTAGAGVVYKTVEQSVLYLF